MNNSKGKPVAFIDSKCGNDSGEDGVVNPKRVAGDKSDVAKVKSVTTFVEGFNTSTIMTKAKEVKERPNNTNNVNKQF